MLRLPCAYCHLCCAAADLLICLVASYPPEFQPLMTPSHVIVSIHHHRVIALLQHQDGHVVYEFEPAVHLGAKLAGVHWWFRSRAHAAELTAGYYNTRDRDGYAPVMQCLARSCARLSFTCVEMRDCEHPPEGRCSPQGLLQQVRLVALHWGLSSYI